jgi:hypothetical protein
MVLIFEANKGVFFEVEFITKFYTADSVGINVGTPSCNFLTPQKRL